MSEFSVAVVSRTLDLFLLPLFLSQSKAQLFKAGVCVSGPVFLAIFAGVVAFGFCFLVLKSDV